MQNNNMAAKILALDTFALFMSARPVLAKAPIEIVHKYFLRCEEYEKFIKLIDKALPRDVFDDEYWLTELISKLAKGGKGTKEDAANLKMLLDNFEALRTFMYNNKIFGKALAGYPNPDVDAIILSDILLEEMKNVKK